MEGEENPNILVLENTSLASVDVDNNGDVGSSSDNLAQIFEISCTKKSNLKRKSSYTCDTENPRKQLKKSISFSAVTAYYFPREQGFTCVPSQGGSTLGMSLKHSFVEELSISEHAAERRQERERLVAEQRQRRKLRMERRKEANHCVQGKTNNAKDQPNSDISDSDSDTSSCYFLQPVSTRQRRTMLREAGVKKIESCEKEDCREIRVSREACGCTCESVCDPSICSCAISGIKCQVDRLSFPCGCTSHGCSNPSGRIEFNPGRVRSHFIQTMMRMDLENSTTETDSSWDPPQTYQESSDTWNLPTFSSFQDSPAEPQQHEAMTIYFDPAAPSPVQNGQNQCSSSSQFETFCTFDNEFVYSSQGPGSAFNQTYDVIHDVSHDVTECHGKEDSCCFKAELSSSSSSEEEIGIETTSLGSIMKESIVSV